MFLKRHAIMTYNDAIEEYVKMLINEEKRIAAVSGENCKLAGLEDCLKAYREEKRSINAAMNSKEQTENDKFDVHAINGELIGQNIKQMFDADEFLSQKEMLQYDYAEFSYPRQTGGKASMNNNLSCQQSTSQDAYQQQAQNHSNHDQKQNGKSMASSLLGFTTSIHNPQSSASIYSQSFKSTFGKYCWTANRWPQLQKQQQNGNIGDASRSGLPKSEADVAAKKQNAKEEPSSSTSSKKIP